MSLTIGTNIASLTARRNLARASDELQRSFRRLSTGQRLLTDDAAGMSISERMRAKMRSVDQAIRNAQDGISLIQTAEGALSEITDSLIRMRELATQASNGTLNSGDRDSLQAEFAELRASIDQIARTTDFNGIDLLSGSGAMVTLQVGPNATTYDQFNVGLQDATAGGLGLQGLDIGGAGDTSFAMSELDAAIDSISDARGTLGARQVGLETRISAMETQSENLASARSRIIDVDFAKETANLVKWQILQQAAIAILAQANVQPQAALQLIQGAAL